MAAHANKLLRFLCIAVLFGVMHSTNALIRDELIRSNRNEYRDNIRYSDNQPMYSNDKDEYRKSTPIHHGQQRGRQEVPHRRHHIIHNDHNYEYDHNNQYSAAMMEQNVESISTTSSHETDEYSDQHQFSAFMFSLFMGEFGLDRFYIGEYTVGTIKACLFVGLLLSPCIVICCFGFRLDSYDTGPSSADVRRVQSGWQICGIFLWVLSALLLLGWMISDIVRFAYNDIKDGEGRTLIPWSEMTIFD